MGPFGGLHRTLSNRYIELPVNPLTGIETNRFTVYSFLFIVDGLIVCGSLAEWLGFLAGRLFAWLGWCKPHESEQINIEIQIFNARRRARSC